MAAEFNILPFCFEIRPLTMEGSDKVYGHRALIPYKAFNWNATSYKYEMTGICEGMNIPETLRAMADAIEKAFSTPNP